MKPAKLLVPSLSAVVAVWAVACSSSNPPPQIPEPTTSTTTADIATTNAPMASAPMPNGSAMADAAPTPMPPPATPLTDEQILMVTHTANSGEVDQAKLAQKKSKNAKVKALAAMMLKDHGDADKKGQDLAKKDNLTMAASPVSTSLESDAKSATSSLDGAAATDFDKAYVDTQVKEHVAVLALIDDKLTPAAKNADVKAYLAEVRPKIAMHLQHAQDLQKEMTK